MKEFKTYSAKPTEVERKWYLVDASEISLGRMCTEIATLLLVKVSQCTRLTSIVATS
jgi:ribosomal protein L13